MSLSSTVGGGITVVKGLRLHPITHQHHVTHEVHRIFLHKTSLNHGLLQETVLIVYSKPTINNLIILSETNITENRLMAIHACSVSHSVYLKSHLGLE